MYGTTTRITSLSIQIFFSMELILSRNKLKSICETSFINIPLYDNFTTNVLKSFLLHLYKNLRCKFQIFPREQPHKLFKFYATLFRWKNLACRINIYREDWDKNQFSEIKAFYVYYSTTSARTSRFLFILIRCWERLCFWRKDV